MISQTHNKQMPYLVWFVLMPGDYATIDKWCYSAWGSPGEIWSVNDQGWLIATYEDAVALNLAWDHLWYQLPLT